MRGTQRTTARANAAPKDGTYALWERQTLCDSAHGVDEPVSEVEKQPDAISAAALARTLPVDRWPGVVTWPAEPAILRWRGPLTHANHRKSPTAASTTTIKPITALTR